MNNKNHYFTGLLFITIGVLFLLGNIGLINWSIFNALYYMWPLILVAIGVNILFNNNVVVRMITFIAIVVAIVIFGMNFSKSDHAYNWGFNFDMDQRIEAITYSEDVDGKTTKGELNVSLGAGDVNIDSVSEYMYYATLPDKITNSKVSYTPNKKKVVIDIENEGDFLIHPKMFERDSHNYDIQLNEDIKWDMNVEIDAVDADFDLQNLNVEYLDMEVGAGDIKLKFGDKSELIQVKLATGAGDITIDVPKSVGIMAEVEGGIHDITFTGDHWKDSDDRYISSNYEEADMKIHLELEIGVGDIKFNH